MQIQIGNSNYYLTSDPYNITLSEMKVKGDKCKDKGKEYLADMGYYRTVPQALTALVDKKVMRSEATSIQELRNDTQAIYNLIDNYFKDNENKIEIDIYRLRELEAIEQKSIRSKLPKKNKEDMY